jgi:hypothetical protein
VGWEDILVAYCERRKDAEDKRLSELGAALDRDPIEAALDLIADEGVRASSTSSSTAASSSSTATIPAAFPDACSPHREVSLWLHRRQAPRRLAVADCQPRDSGASLNVLTSARS